MSAFVVAAEALVRELRAAKRADPNDAVQAYRTEGVHLF
jgi:hypothetical protein